MKFYERYYQNNYEEIITYYPRYYRDVFEMVEILKALGRVTDTLEEQIEQAYLNHFIMQADDNTIGIWERILEITDTVGLSLYQRKCAVIGRLCGVGHIGEPEIRAIISNYTENGVGVDFSRGVISVIIDGEVFGEDILLNTLLRRIPAHLALSMFIHTTRQFREELQVQFAGALSTVVSGGPPAVKHHSTVRTDSAGGLFCHTHTTSKFMG